MKKLFVFLLALLLFATAVAETQIIDTFREAAILGINEGEGERIDSITLEDGKLLIVVYLPEENAAPLTPGMYAQGRVETIGEEILADESLDQYWDLVVFDFPNLGAKCYLGKKHIQDIGFGRCFDLLEIYAQIPD